MEMQHEATATQPKHTGLTAHNRQYHGKGTTILRKKGMVFEKSNAFFGYFD
jgi:hypothetical protein